MSLPIRARLTVWYAALLAVIILALGAFLVLRLRSDLQAAIDRDVRSAAAMVAAGYTAEGTDEFLEVADAWAAATERDRTAAVVYAVGWTQHSVGVQFIRTAAIIQLLLGHVGRPGGGIMAMRGHASIQGCTDVPTLFNLLPGYLAMPTAHKCNSLDTWISSLRGENQKGFWRNADAYAISL